MFLENSEISGSTTNHDLDLQEVQEAGGNHSSVIIPPIIPLVPNAAPNITDPPSPNQNPPNLDTANAETLSVTEPENQLRRSSRATNFDDFITYFTEVENIGKLTDPTSYRKAISSD